jgi:hypothetical protein
MAQAMAAAAAIDSTNIHVTTCDLGGTIACAISWSFNFAENNLYFVNLPQSSYMKEK